MTTLEFNFLRIPVRIHLWFVLSALLLGALYRDLVSPEGALQNASWLGAWVLVVFQGVFSHELGHALVGRAFGLAPRIDLVAFGGRTGFQGTAPLSPPKALLVSAAGPAVSVATGLVALAVWLLAFDPAAEGWQVTLLQSFILVNLVWGLFNLVPVVPLDGGQILMAVGEWVSPRRGRQLAAYVSLGFSVLLGASMVYFQEPFIAILAVLLVWHSYQVLMHERILGLGLTETMARATEALRTGQADPLLRMAAVLLGRAQDVPERDRALHLMAWGQVLGGKPAQAREALEATSASYTADPSLLGAILVEEGKPDDALPHLEEALERGGPFVESRMVQAIVAAGRYDEALVLLEDEKGRGIGPLAVARIYEGATETGYHEAALGLAKVLFRRRGDGDSAVEVARCLARSERPEEGLTWLDKARIAGFDDISRLDDDPSLAPIRALPGWSDLRDAFSG